MCGCCTMIRAVVFLVCRRESSKVIPYLILILILILPAVLHKVYILWFKRKLLGRMRSFHVTSVHVRSYLLGRVLCLYLLTLQGKSMTCETVLHSVYPMSGIHSRLGTAVAVKASSLKSREALLVPLSFLRTTTASLDRRRTRRHVLTREQV